MNTKVIKINPNKPDKAKMKIAAGLIDAGCLVAFPTETVYGIGCRVSDESLNKLNRLKGRDVGKYYTLHIGQKTDLSFYVPSVGLKAEKLIRKAWPGPVTIVFDLSSEDINKQQGRLNGAVFHNLYKDNSIGVRCPDSRIASVLLSESESSVVAPSANITSQPPAVDAEGVLSSFTGRIDMLLDGGECEYKKSSTVVKIKKGIFEVLREGVIPSKELKALSEVQILFVCTGNTCRSPMAEGIFREYLGEKLGCEVDELEKMGYKVVSAGVLNIEGSPVSSESIKACSAKGIDISNHKSRALTEKLISESDLIFAMSGEHRERVVSLCPESASRCVLLAEGRNIPDPIGQSQEVYYACAELIEETVKRRIDEMQI